MQRCMKRLCIWITSKTYVETWHLDDDWGSFFLHPGWCGKSSPLMDDVWWTRIEKCLHSYSATSHIIIVCLDILRGFLILFPPWLLGSVYIIKWMRCFAWWIHRLKSHKIIRIHRHRTHTHHTSLACRCPTTGALCWWIMNDIAVAHAHNNSAAPTLVCLNIRHQQHYMRGYVRVYWCRVRSCMCGVCMRCICPALNVDREN